GSSTCGFKSKIQVILYIIHLKRQKMELHGYPLPQGLIDRILQHAAKFWLPHKDNSQKVPVVQLVIGQETYLVKYLPVRHKLRLVNNQYRRDSFIMKQEQSIGNLIQQRLLVISRGRRRE